MEVNSSLIKTSFFWKLLERFGVLGIQFILQIILARLLSPEYYGILSIMIIFINLANVFIQQGFNTALIQNKDVNDDDYSSVLWVTLVIALILYILIYVISPLISDFYNMPAIVRPLRVLALMLFPGAFNSVQLAKLSKEMDFKKVFISNISGIIISGIVGIIIAIYGGGLWALVFQTMLNILVTCIVMCFTVKLKIKLKVNFARVKKLFSYGWKLLVSSLLDTLYQEIRSLVIGKKYNSVTLGFYNRGKQFPQFIISGINGAVQSVMLPAMSIEQDDKEKVKIMMRNSITMSAYIIFPIMVGLASVATPTIKLLLTEKWLPCVPYMQVYCFSLAFYPVHSCNLQAINAMGRSDIFLKLEIIKKSYGFVILTIAVLFFDSPIVIAFSGLITTWISWFLNSYPNKKLIDYSYKEQITDLIPSMFMAGIMGIIVLLLGNLSLNTLLLLVIQIFTGIIIYLFLSMVIKPEPYKFLINQIQIFLKNRR